MAENSDDNRHNTTCIDAVVMFREDILSRTWSQRGVSGFTGKTKQNFDHTSITSIINLKPQTLQPQTY